MNRTSLVLGLLGLLGLTVGMGAVSADDFRKKETKSPIAGSWKVTAAESNGNDLGGKIKETTWVIGDKTFTARLPQEGKGEFAYQLGKGDKFGTIDIEVLRSEVVRDGGPAKRIYVGIYTMDKDTLKICYTSRGKERPTAFEAKTGSDATLFIFKREVTAREGK